MEVGKKVVMGINESYFAWMTVPESKFGSAGGFKFKYTRVYDTRIRPTEALSPKAKTS
jgi:hypothetical protein